MGNRRGIKLELIDVIDSNKYTVVIFEDRLGNLRVLYSQECDSDNAYECVRLRDEAEEIYEHCFAGQTWEEIA